MRGSTVVFLGLVLVPAAVLAWFGLRYAEAVEDLALQAAEREVEAARAGFVELAQRHCADLARPSEVEEAVRWFLGSLPRNRATLTAFQAALSHPSAEIRKKMVGHFDVGKFIEDFGPLVSDKNAEIRGDVVHEIARWSSRDALPYLHKATEDPDAYVRRTAAEGLESIADPTSLPHLKKLTRDPDSLVRDAAFRAIEYLKEQQAQRELAGG